MKSASIFVGALLAATVQGQEPPSRRRAPSEITGFFPAGSSADVTARLLADGMSKQLGGAKVLVINRPGAGGAIGYKYVASQKADGYSIVWNSNSISTTFHSGMLPFDYHEFDAVARVLVESPVIAVRGDAKWKTLSELIAAAESRPQQVTVRNSRIGFPVPKATPKAAVAALEGAIRRTAESADFAQASERLGVRPAFMPAEEFGNLIAKEDAELARIMQLIGLKK